MTESTCSYCGQKAIKVVHYKNKKACPDIIYREIKVKDDTAINGRVCSNCDGMYDTIRLRQMVRKGKTMAEAKNYLTFATNIYTMKQGAWTGSYR